MSMEALALGIEFGSTRIKAVLVDATAAIRAEGLYDWQNTQENGLWTYPLSAVTEGLQQSFAQMKQQYEATAGHKLTTLSAIGISGMMHGYLAFDAAGQQLVPFRTWRNTNTAVAAAELSEALGFNIPLRWSAAQLYQSVLDKEPHVQAVASLTTLAGYVHFRLTGERVLGIGDAAGMFPVENGCYRPTMLATYNNLLATHGVTQRLEAFLPAIRLAGEAAGTLTPEGALLLDPTGDLIPGIPFCPPEGDGGTGMVATNCVAPHTATVSAGTSTFLMAVLDRNLSRPYPEIDMVTTPDGHPVAMLHTNNGTSEIDAFEQLCEEILALTGSSLPRGELYDKLFTTARSSDADTGGLTGYNFLAGEPIAAVEPGRPLLTRLPGGTPTLSNLMQAQLYAAVGALALGRDLLQNEGVKIDTVCGQGGFFKAPFVGQNTLSAVLDAPVTVRETAGEGGAWGMALLALFSLQHTLSLPAFLQQRFAGVKQTTVTADAAAKEQFARFFRRYRQGLPAAAAAGAIQ